MEAIAFVKNYLIYIDEISEVIKPELLHILDELRQIDPHDLVMPDTFFIGESQAKGIVWEMFIKRVKRYI
jgi:L-fucose mutarotase/ribose pyranase (RbsD/FucU family)